jgi:hypothetical protein
MRTLHRLCAAFAVLLLLYLAISGVLMQSIDLYTLFKGAPESDPIRLSINEGRDGPGNFQVLSRGDFSAATLPADFDYLGAFDTVLQAVHSTVPGVAPRFIEVRMANGVPVGQVRLGDTVVAFDTRTGVRVPEVGVNVSFRPPPSARQTIKEFHRFWRRQDVPGVWVELVCGLSLWVLIIAGLVMYFRLLKARAKLRRYQPFWFAGGTWRSLHRIVSAIAALFLIAVAASGTWLGFESVYHTFAFRPPGDVSAPLSDGDVRSMASATLAAIRREEPGSIIKVVRLRVYGAMKQGVVVCAGDETRQLVFDTDTKRRATLTEPGYPASGFPLGTQVHEDVKHFHSGYLFGVPARIMDLFAGLCLIFLCVSGSLMYYELWMRRRKSGRPGFLWT